MDRLHRQCRLCVTISIRKLFKFDNPPRHNDGILLPANTVLLYALPEASGILGGRDGGGTSAQRHILVSSESLHRLGARLNLCRRRMQMGLVVGFLVNLMFGLWRYLLDGS